MSGNVLELTDESFEKDVLQSPGAILVDFWAAWCPPCRRLAPVVEALADEFAGRVRVAKLDVDRSPEVAGRYGIFSIPTLILFRDGEAVDRRVGALPIEHLRQMIGAAADQPAAPESAAAAE